MTPAPRIVYLVGILAILIWGGSPAATKIAVGGFDAFSLAALRIVPAALLILPFVLFARLPLPKNRTQWGYMALAVLPGTIGYVLLFGLGLEKTSTLHAALIIASAPLFTGLVGFSFDQKWPRMLWWVGALVAFSGEIYLILSNTNQSTQASLYGDLLVLGSIICVSFGYVAGARLSNEIGTWAATGWSVILSALLLAPFFFYLVIQIDWDQISLPAWTALAYLVIFISIGGYVCWYWAIAKLGVAKIAPLQFFLPVVSLVIGVIFFEEEITLELIIAAGIIFCGIVLTKRSTRKIGD